MRKKLVIFDLDGTLLNSIADLAASTSYALEQLGFPTHTLEAYAMMVGNGVGKLFERALPESECNAETVENMRELFVPHYDQNNCCKSAPYEGIVDLLVALQEKGLLLAVASNKYQAATEKIVAHYFPMINFVSVLGQRDGVAIKPDPQIVNDILAVAKVDKSDVLYIGDTGVDMQTANSAGVEQCGVTWGFRSREELMQFSPFAIVDKAEDILNYI